MGAEAEVAGFGVGLGLRVWKGREGEFALDRLSLAGDCAIPGPWLCIIFENSFFANEAEA